MQQKQGVRFYKTPDSVLARQLVVYDQAAEKRKDNAIFREIEESQKAFAARAVRWFLDTQVGSRMAYNHYFAPKKPAEKKKA
jgi:TRAP-type mannitol/chloroaromatic compound transport system substrate-binding protein